MRVTKAMKEYVEESLSKKRQEKNNEFRAAYDERKKKPAKKLKHYYPNFMRKLIIF